MVVRAHDEAVRVFLIVLVAVGADPPRILLVHRVEDRDEARRAVRIGDAEAVVAVGVLGAFDVARFGIDVLAPGVLGDDTEARERRRLVGNHVVIAGRDPGARPATIRVSTHSVKSPCTVDQDPFSYGRSRRTESRRRLKSRRLPKGTASEGPASSTPADTTPATENPLRPTSQRICAHRDPSRGPLFFAPPPNKKRIRPHNGNKHDRHQPVGIRQPRSPITALEEDLPCAFSFPSTAPNRAATCSGF